MGQKPKTKKNQIEHHSIRLDKLIILMWSDIKSDKKWPSYAHPKLWGKSDVLANFGLRIDYFEYIYWQGLNRLVLFVT